MKKNFRYLLVVVLGFIASLSLAQTTLLEQSMLTPGSFDTFTAFNTTGTQAWFRSPAYGAVCTGYLTGQNYENEDWLISPAINLTDTENVTLTFSHTRGSTPVMNVGVAEGWYAVFATADYTGDPATTTWTELEGLNQTLPAAWQFIPSGELIIPDAVKSTNTRFAFRYKSSNTQSATWEIKNVKVTGEPLPTSSNAGIFKITNWNTEWLGCTQFGPTDETLQVSNIATAMLAMNSDIYCLQEVSNSASYPSMATLVSLLGPDEWDGAMVPGQTGDCAQRQGIVYRKSRVQLVSAALLSTGNEAQGNSYYYNWSSGRYPALYKVNLVSGTTLIPLSLVNIHAKAEDGNAMSYTRRLGGSEALKTILDGADYNADNLMVIGDFNDYLIGTTNLECQCTDSPYKNFMDDTDHYTGITSGLTTVINWNTFPIIEHTIISDELADNYLANTAAQELAVAQSIENYGITTSDHYPVSAMLQFSVLDTPEYVYNRKNWTLYPNPVHDELNFDTNGLAADAVTEIYDVTGRRMRYDRIDADTVNVASLPPGVYILKAGSRHGRFVKE